jgi:hypothetical protein
MKGHGVGREVYTSEGVHFELVQSPGRVWRRGLYERW